MDSTGRILKKYIPKTMKNRTIATVLEVKPQYLSNVLNDIKKPSKQFLEKFITLFSVSQEDKNLIEEYEKLRMIPTDIRKDYFKIIQGVTDSIKRNIYVYFLKDNKLVRAKNENIYTNIDSALKFFSEDDYFVIIDTLDCPSFFKGDILVFEKYTNKELNDKFCIIENQDTIKIYKVKQVKKKYIVEDIFDENNVDILNNINILAILKARIIKEN